MPSPLPPDPYAALGVDKDADRVAIRKARHKLLLKHDPDRIRNDVLRDDTIDQWAKWKEILQAYEILSDPVCRQRYDDRVRLAELRKEGMMAEPPQPTSGSTSRTYRDSYDDRRARYDEPLRERYRKHLGYEERMPPQSKASKKEKQRSSTGAWPGNAAAGAAGKFEARAEKIRISKADEKKLEREKLREGKEKEKRRKPAYFEDADSDSNSSGARPVLKSTRSKTTSYFDRPTSRRQTPARTERASDVDEMSEDEKWERQIEDGRDSLAKVANRPSLNRTASDAYQYWVGSKSKGGGRRPRASSVASNASSRNRSLRGSDGFEEDYKNPEFVRPRSGSGSEYKIRRSSPGLPPTPTRRNSSHADRSDDRSPSHFRHASTRAPPRWPTVDYYEDTNQRRRYSLPPSGVGGATQVVDNSRPGTSKNIPWISTEAEARAEASAREERGRERREAIERQNLADDVYDEQMLLGLKNPFEEEEIQHSSGLAYQTTEPESGMRADHADLGEKRTTGEPPTTMPPKTATDEVRKHKNAMSFVGFQKGDTEDTALHRDKKPGGKRYAMAGRHLDDLTLDQNQIPLSPEVTVDPMDVNWAVEMRQCYLCGENVKLTRRRDWQDHVLQDIRPYQCLEEYCPDADVTHSRLGDLRKHYVREHTSAPIFLAAPMPCYFCDETMEPEFESRLVHLARHLVEVALATVPQQYEDWEFYSDTSRETLPTEINPVEMDGLKGQLKASIDKESPALSDWQTQQSVLPERRTKAMKHDVSELPRDFHVSDAPPLKQYHKFSNTDPEISYETAHGQQHHQRSNQSTTQDHSTGKGSKATLTSKADTTASQRQHDQNAQSAFSVTPTSVEAEAGNVQQKQNPPQPSDTRTEQPLKESKNRLWGRRKRLPHREPQP